MKNSGFISEIVLERSFPENGPTLSKLYIDYVAGQIEELIKKASMEAEEHSDVYECVCEKQKYCIDNHALM